MQGYLAPAAYESGILAAHGIGNAGKSHCCSGNGVQQLKLCVKEYLRPCTHQGDGSATRERLTVIAQARFFGKSKLSRRIALVKTALKVIAKETLSPQWVTRGDYWGSWWGCGGGAQDGWVGTGVFCGVLYGECESWGGRGSEGGLIEGGGEGDG